MAPTAPFALDRQTILWVDEQTDRQTDLYLEVDKQMDRQTDLYFEVDEQTDRQTAGQTELRNYYIDSRGNAPTTKSKTLETLPTQVDNQFSTISRQEISTNF